MSLKKCCASGGAGSVFLGIGVALIVIVYLGNEQVETDTAALQVSVQQGALAGYKITTRKDRHVFAFEGIPYAAPPIGDLRFRVCKNVTAISLSHITFVPLGPR